MTGNVGLLDLRHSRRALSLLIVTLILLLAAVLRLAGFEETPIAGDQTGILATAAEIASFRAFPLTGTKASAGVMFAPLPQYLAAIPLLVVPKVVAVQWFFSMLDLLSLAWLYRAVRQAVGFHAAWISSLLYATNPWIVKFVRLIWQPSLVPAAATLAFAAFLLLLAPALQRRQEIMAAGVIGSVLMSLLHLSALPWTAICLVLGFILAWRRGLWRGFWIGVGVSMLLALPYLIFLIKVSFADLTFMLRAGSKGKWSIASLLLTSDLVTGAGILYASRIWAESVHQLLFVHTILRVILASAFVVVLLRALRRPEERALLLFVASWSVLTSVLFLRSSLYLQHYYLLFIFPAPFVLAGCGVEGSLGPLVGGSWGRVSRAAGRVGATLLLFTALWWASLWGVRIRLEEEGRIGPPTRAWLVDRVAVEVQRYLGENPSCQVIILTRFDGDLSPFDWIRSLVHSDRVRVVPAGQGLIIPPDCTCYMLGPQATEADLAPVLDRAEERQDMHIPANPPWRFFCVSAREELPDALAEWENGLRLLRVVLEGQPERGGRMRISYTWHYRAVTSQTYHFFNHLLQGETLVAQADGPGVPDWYWRDDDVLVTSFDLVLPASLEPGEYRLRVGVYGWPDLERVLLVNGDDGYEVGRWSIGR